MFADREAGLLAEVDTTEGLLVEVDEGGTLVGAGTKGLLVEVAGPLAGMEGQLVEVDTRGPLVRAGLLVEVGMGEALVSGVRVVESETVDETGAKGLPTKAGKDCLLADGDTDSLLVSREGLPVVAAESLLVEVDRGLLVEPSTEGLLVGGATEGLLIEADSLLVDE